MRLKILNIEDLCLLPKVLEMQEKFTTSNLKSLRPKLGLEPKYIFKLLGKKSKKKLVYGTPITKKNIKKII